MSHILAEASRYRLISMHISDNQVIKQITTSFTQRYSFVLASARYELLTA